MEREPKGEASALVAIFGDVRTERLALRRPRLDDAEAMFRVHGDPATNQYNPHGPDTDLETSVRTLRSWLEQWEREGFGYWAVTLPGAEEVSGFGGIRRVAWRDGDALNLYYRLVPAVWGHGYATELARTAVRLARAHLAHLHLPVVARTRIENVPSQRVALAAGLARLSDLDTDEHIVFVLG